MDKHFPKDGPLNKIFNRNTIKISYSCMPNIDSEITKSNLKAIEKSKNEKNNETTCNCRIKASCPVEGKWLYKSVIYKATVTYINKKQFYIGSTARNFKTRYYEHMHSFKNQNQKELTKLSSFVDAAKFNENMIKNIIKWNIMHKINQCKPSRIWTLCNIEWLEQRSLIKKHHLTPELN